MRRLIRDPVQGDVVRARLDALVDELNARGQVERPGRPGDRPSPPRDTEEAAPSRDGDHDADAVVAARRAIAFRDSALRRAWEFGRAHAAVVGIIGLVAVLTATWTLTRARTVAVADATPSVVAAVHAPDPTPSATPAALRVHVLGAVANPGVVTLAEGDRVEDALAAAGGLAAGARPGELNLAAPVADGDQIVVGDEKRPGGDVRGPSSGAAADGQRSSAAGGAASGKVDLNKATAQQLESLPGVGPVTAQAILRWREQHQKFGRVEELQEVDGIGPKTFAQLQPLVRV
ncbi:MAG: helix-hairpin-helix domain-containing protein [Nigerium sp.]|nr:helix-hairpin-helix domain-containing protein [Nigerium sp.]